MLPAKARLTDRDEFTTVVRRGRRCGRSLVVMHLLLPEVDPDGSSVGVSADSSSVAQQSGNSRVGFVVSKAVGGSVVRHRVARRLRHLMRERLVDAPQGSRIVVRALPASALADSASLGADLERTLRGALGKGSGRRSSQPRRPSSTRTSAEASADARDVGVPDVRSPDLPAASGRP